ncbi:hypothetical protein Y032_0207g2049 [Ancylostoma ceylanicum]|nr:hypothetical protein Y032_0207g2049 [Ancylostoma ceylanicum]
MVARKPSKKKADKSKPSEKEADKSKPSEKEADKPKSRKTGGRQKQNRKQQPLQVTQAMVECSVAANSQVDPSSLAVAIRRSPRLKQLNTPPLRRSPRLLGKVRVDYREQLGMRVPKAELQLCHIPPKKPAPRGKKRVTCMVRKSNTRSVDNAPASAQRAITGSAASPQVGATQPSNETTQGRKRKGKKRGRAVSPEAGPVQPSNETTQERKGKGKKRGRAASPQPGAVQQAVQQVDTPLRAGNGSRRRGVLSPNTSLNAGTQQRAGTSKMVMMRTFNSTTPTTCDHENMTHGEIVASRNRAVSGSWVTMISTASQELERCPRPLTMLQIRNVVSYIFPPLDVEQYESAVSQLVHRVTERWGTGAIRRDAEVPLSLPY